MLVCEPLTRQHDRQSFDCKRQELNIFLQQYANQQSKRNLSKTYVLVDTDNPNVILGFYSLSAIHIDQRNFKTPLFGLPKNIDIPAVLLGRLAVDYRHTGKGFANHLLKDAFNIIKQVAELIGLALIVVDAKNEELVLSFGSNS